ncbi:hypothetical protein BX659_10952 [Orenia metallireducens]|uniref:Uncharacterized protein n=1 Tax=Orenia metallireducens TaxID=1413210 RepID=A0A285H2X6_9FIRM|nr:hypothetical protein BX659_10952 [Orenia metallireducens]SNY30048.1 hypothetical protein SAMN06265827_11352 [Orenia metallireducens]
MYLISNQYNWLVIDITLHYILSTTNLYFGVMRVSEEVKEEEYNFEEDVEMAVNEIMGILFPEDKEER